MARKYFLSHFVDVFVLLVDQDSSVSTNYIHDVATQVLLLPDYRSKYIFAPAYNRSSPRILFPCIPRMLRSKWKPIFDTKASGLLIHLDILKNFLFDEQLYVDYVDWFFCWNASRNGILILEHKAYPLKGHISGDRYKFKNTNILFKAPSLHRRRLQMVSALKLLLRLRTYFLFPPPFRLFSILLRLIINPFLNTLEYFHLICIVT